MKLTQLGLMKRSLDSPGRAPPKAERAVRMYRAPGQAGSFSFSNLNSPFYFRQTRPDGHATPAKDPRAGVQRSSISLRCLGYYPGRPVKHMPVARGPPVDVSATAERGDEHAGLVKFTAWRQPARQGERPHFAFKQSEAPSWFAGTGRPNTSRAQKCLAL